MPFFEKNSFCSFSGMLFWVIWQNTFTQILLNSALQSVSHCLIRQYLSIYKAISISSCPWPPAWGLSSIILQPEQRKVVCNCIWYLLELRNFHRTQTHLSIVGISKIKHVFQCQNQSYVTYDWNISQYRQRIEFLSSVKRF